MQVRPWKLLGVEHIFKKFGRGVEKWQFELPEKRVEDFYIKAEGPTVCIVALTPEKKVIVVEQFRPGPQKVLLELPGGFAKEDRLDQQIASELLEETGYQGKVQRVAQLWDDGYSNLRRYCFVATDCCKVASPNPERNEFLNVKLLDIKDFRKLLRSGEMTDVECGYLGLDFLGLL